MEQIYTPKQGYKVLVRCFTYNQSKYIEDALNGFAMQKTDFPFVCLVMDDCSTDGEQDVIKAWIKSECDMEKAEYVDIELSNIIFVPHRSNKNCIFAFYLLKQNLYGTGKKMPLVDPWREHCEYEAFCEGDDYWILDSKLQMQVEFLDTNKDYGMCYTDFNIKYETRSKYMHNCFKSHSDNYPIVNDIYTWVTHHYYVGPMTWLVRSSLFKEAIEKSFVNVDGTYSYFAYFLKYSKVYVLKDINSAVYRIISNSATQTRSIKKEYNRDLGLYKTQIELANRYLEGDRRHYAIEEINKDFYSKCLKLQVALGDMAHLERSKEYVAWGLVNRTLYNIAKSKLLRNFYKRFYETFLYARYIIKNTVRI